MDYKTEKRKNLQGGFIGLLSLLIAVAIIGFFIVRTGLFGTKDNKNVIEQGTDEIQHAKDVTKMIEQNDANSVKELGQ